MAKVKNRTYSRHTRRAVHLLGMLIRTGRIERKITTRELAERAGISRDLLYRIENGDPRVSLGAAFEAAAIVGVPLFAPDAASLDVHSRHAAEKLTLLPKAVRKRHTDVKDDF